jgi:hypothetical protein
MTKKEPSTALLRAFLDGDAWDKAGWCGVAYLHDPSGVDPPAVGLIFKNRTAGRKIFKGWLQLLGPRDMREELRLAIIEGDVPGEEPGYSVHIGWDPDRIAEREREQGGADDPAWRLTAVCGRVHRMKAPPGSPNLTNFKAEYAKYGRYQLLPVYLAVGRPQPDPGLMIEKRLVHFRTVEELGPDDIDRLALVTVNR